MTDKDRAVVVVGSLHYDIMIDAPDRPAKGETVTGQRWYPKFGGKGGNQAVAAAGAGVETRMVGAVGRDAFTSLILDHLEAAGIGTSRVTEILGTGTGMSVAITDAGGDYGAVIVSGANLAIDPACLDDDSLWQGASVLILQNEVPEAVNIAAAKIARDRGITVCHNAAPSRDLSDGFCRLIDILVVNAIEARDLCGTSVTNLDSALAAATTLAARVPTVIVTAGGDGVALAAADGTTCTRPARPVDLVSTHGAGDVFVGTFCACLAAGHDRVGALSTANETAALHVSRKHGA